MWRDLFVAFQYLQGTCKKDGDSFFLTEPVVIEEGVIIFKLTDGRFRLDVRIFFFRSEIGETLKQVILKGGRFPVPENTQGQVGCDLSSPI